MAKLSANAIAKFVKPEFYDSETNEQLSILRKSWELSRDKLKRLNDELEKTVQIIMTIIKNEQQFLKEWIDYHKSIGVDKIYIGDNNVVLVAGTQPKVRRTIVRSQ